MEKYIEIKINWELFQAGRPLSHDECPVALFLKRNPRVTEVHVEYELITFGNKDIMFQIIPSEELSLWMRVFDDRRYKVGPKTFTEKVTKI